MTSMRSVYERLRSTAGLIGSAVRVAGALENRANPNPQDLRRMGIDPRAFLTIGHG